jgi:hypothetical protein
MVHAGALETVRPDSQIRIDQGKEIRRTADTERRKKE